MESIFSIFFLCVLLVKPHLDIKVTKRIIIFLVSRDRDGHVSHTLQSPETDEVPPRELGAFVNMGLRRPESGHGSKFAGNKTIAVLTHCDVMVVGLVVSMVGVDIVLVVVRGRP